MRTLRIAVCCALLSLSGSGLAFGKQRTERPSDGTGDITTLPESPENFVMHLARNTVMPTYPQADQAARISGPAVVEFIVDLDGRVTQPQIVVSPDQTIGQAVLDAVTQWTFKPMSGGQPPHRVKIRGDLTFYFILENGTSRVLTQLPPGKTFPNFPHSLHEKQTLEAQENAERTVLQRERETRHQLPPASFTEIPAEFRKELTQRSCFVPQGPETPEPNNVIRGEFARKGQMDWAALCAKDDQIAIFVFWGKPTACSAEVGSSTVAEGNYFRADNNGGNVTFLRSIHQVSRQQIVDLLQPTEAGGSRWVAKPPEYPALDHFGIGDDGFLGGYVSYVHYCSHGKWFRLESTAE